MERIKKIVENKLEFFSRMKLSKRNKKILYIIILFTLLFFARFIDFTILSILGNEEHYHLLELPYYQDNSDEIYYQRIGFSSYNNSKKELLLLSKQRKEKVIIVNFFDLIHPTRYLIFNKGEREFISLPWTWAGLEKEKNIEAVKGITEVNIFKFDYISVLSKGKKEGNFTPIIGSIVPFMIDIYNAEKEKKTKDKNSFDLSFDIRTHYWESSIFIKQIYFFYFYIPLVIILLLLRKYKIYLAFYYFIIMPVISTPKYFMFYAPSLGLTGLDYEISILLPIVTLIITIGFGILFIKNIKSGFRLFKEKKLEMKEKFIILYFLLLPIFLRF